jgi:hypothetical protein
MVGSGLADRRRSATAGCARTSPHVFPAIMRQRKPRLFAAGSDFTMTVISDRVCETALVVKIQVRIPMNSAGGSH